jgi:sugar phosphate isomerase/epimerase
MKKMFVLVLFCVGAMAFTPSFVSHPLTETSKKDWTIGLQLWTFRVFSFYDAIAKADSCGIRYVQAFPNQKLGGKWQGAFGPAMDAKTRKEVKDYVKSKNIIINSFGVTGAKNEAEWRKLFEFAKDMNIPLIVAEPSREQWDYVDRMAGEFHIPVAIHDHPKPAHFWHPDSVLEATKNHPNIGACADLGHWARNGLDVVDCLKKLEGKIWNVHFKDVAEFGKLNAADTLPGKGILDFPSIFKELQRQDYKGSFSIEHESNWYNNAGDVIEIVKFYNEQVKQLPEK